MAMIARALLKEFPQEAGIFAIGELQLGSEIIRNHNGLLGRYPGADGMKTGFTCPAGFNVVASANQGGRHLIVVVLGAASARLRNQEAADLFDRGFAMGGGGLFGSGGGGLGPLDSLPAGSGTVSPHSNVCQHRSAAAIAAEEEEGSVGTELVRAGGRGGGATFVAAAGGAPAHTQLSGEQPQFEPVAVFVGPIPGWNGPVLGPRDGAAVAGLPDNAKAYAGDKSDATGTAAQPGEPDASQVLQGAVKTPPPDHPKRRGKPAVATASAAEQEAKHRQGAASIESKAKMAKGAKASLKAVAHPVKPPAKAE